MLKLLKNKVLLGALVLVFGFFFASSAQAATCTASSGDWDEVGTWSCGNVPLATDDVVIPTNVDVVINVAGAVANTVTMQDANAANNNITMSSPGTLVVTGAVTIAASTGAATSTLDVGNASLTAAGISITGGGAAGESRVLVSTGTITSSSGITFAGTAGTAKLTATGAATITLSGTTGTLSAGGTVAFGASGTLVFTGTGAQTIPVYSYRNMTINKASGTATLAGNITTFAGNLLISEGTFATSTHDIDITGTTTIESGGTLNHGTGTKVHNGNVTINAGGTWTESGAAVVSYLGHLTNNGTFTASTGVHSFDIDNRSINGSVSIPNLTIAQLTTNNGILTVSTALAGASTLTNSATGVLYIGGTSAITGLTATAVGNRVSYNAAGNQTVKAVSYYNLTLEGSGEKAIGSGIAVGNQLTIGGTALADLTGTTTAPLLTFGGAAKAVGVYGSSASAAAAANQSDTAFLSTATGTVSVTTGIVVVGGGGLSSGGGSSGGSTTTTTTTTTTSTPSGTTTSEVAQSTTPVTVQVSPEVTMTTIDPGCSGGNKYNTSTGQLCVNNSGGGETVTITSGASYDFGTSTLKKGSRGEAVKEMQRFLNATMNLGLVVDGIFGPKTTDVIKKWQASKGLVADGLVGPKTKAQMHASVQ